MFEKLSYPQKLRVDSPVLSTPGIRFKTPITLRKIVKNQNDQEELISEKKTGYKNLVRLSL